jgi:hypothetical protein
MLRLSREYLTYVNVKFPCHSDPPTIKDAIQNSDSIEMRDCSRTQCQPDLPTTRLEYPTSKISVADPDFSIPDLGSKRSRICIKEFKYI